MRRLRHSAVAATARSISTRAASGARACAARTRARPGKVRCALRRSAPRPGRRARRNLRHGRDDELRLGCFHGRGLAPDVRRSGTARFLLRLRLLLLLWRRRRGWRRLRDIEHSNYALGSLQIHFPGEVQQHQKKRDVDGHNRRNSASSISVVDARSVSHGRTTPGVLTRCAHEKAPAATRPALSAAWLWFSGASCSCVPRRDWPCRPCWLSRAAWRDPLRQSRASNLRFCSSPFSFSQLPLGNPTTPPQSSGSQC